MLKSYRENVLELNASDDRGLSIINNTIIPFCQKITNSSEKLVILDEADSITNKAQNLLSNIIAEYKKNCRFVFVCNDSIKINESSRSSMDMEPTIRCKICAIYFIEQNR